MNGLDGRACIITGGGSEIACACARYLTSQGFRVLLTDEDEKKMADTVAAVEKAGGKVSAFPAKLTDDGQVTELLQFARDTFGTPTILVNCFDLQAHFVTRPLHEITPDEWNRLVSENLTGSFTVLKHLMPVMMDAGWGSVINILSILALRGTPEYSAFSTLQGGILSMTRAAAVEYAPYDIRVNAILAGFVKTAEYRSIRAHKDPEFEKKLVRHIPLKRLGTPDEIAHLAGFLASDEASYITGAAIPVDGGYSIV